MSEDYLITDKAVLETLLAQLESELFFPIRQLNPKLYLYSVSQLHTDLRTSSKILNEAYDNMHREKRRLLLWTFLALVSLSLALHTHAFSMCLGISLGLALTHLHRMRQYFFIVNEMSDLLPLLSQALNIAYSNNLEKMVIAKVRMEKGKDDHIMTSPRGNIISFQSK